MRQHIQDIMQLLRLDGSLFIAKPNITAAYINLIAIVELYAVFTLVEINVTASVETFAIAV